MTAYPNLSEWAAGSPLASGRVLHGVLLTFVKFHALQFGSSGTCVKVLCLPVDLLDIGLFDPSTKHGGRTIHCAEFHLTSSDAGACGSPAGSRTTIFPGLGDSLLRWEPCGCGEHRRSRVEN